jgi:hypothetical protein
LGKEAGKFSVTEKGKDFQFTEGKLYGKGEI